MSWVSSCASTLRGTFTSLKPCILHQRQLLFETKDTVVRASGHNLFVYSYKMLCARASHLACKPAVRSMRQPIALAPIRQPVAVRAQQDPVKTAHDLINAGVDALKKMDADKVSC